MKMKETVRQKVNPKPMQLYKRKRVRKFQNLEQMWGLLKRARQEMRVRRIRKDLSQSRVKVRVGQKIKGWVGTVVCQITRLIKKNYTKRRKTIDITFICNFIAI